MLGDEYVKGEFRAHREVDNPMHIVGLLFPCRGTIYAELEEGGGEGWERDGNGMERRMER